MATKRKARGSEPFKLETSAQSRLSNKAPTNADSNATTLIDISTAEQRHNVYICTKPGTSIELFEIWILALPDRGIGFKKHWPALGWQTYLTRLTDLELLAVQEVRWVEFAVKQPEGARV